MYAVIPSRFSGPSNTRCEHVDGLVQGCSALAMELLQSCTKPSMCYHKPAMTSTYQTKHATSDTFHEHSCVPFNPGSTAKSESPFRNVD